MLLLALSKTAVYAQTKVKEVKPGAVEFVRIENSLG
jgi:hypothetical protein